MRQALVTRAPFPFDTAAPLSCVAGTGHPAAVDGQAVDDENRRAMPARSGSHRDLIISRLDWARDSHASMHLGDVRDLLASVPDLDRGVSAIVSTSM
jgi:hypothetical protein